MSHQSVFDYEAIGKRARELFGRPFYEAPVSATTEDMPAAQNTEYRKCTRACGTQGLYGTISCDGSCHR